MAKRKTPKQNPDDLFKLAERLIERDKRRDEMFGRLEVLYDQAAEDDITTGNDRASTNNAQDDAVHVHSAHATNAINLIVDTAADLKKTIVVPAASEHLNAKKIADDIESWLLSLLSANEMQQKVNYNADMAWVGAMRSMVVLRTLFTDTLVTEDAKSKGYKLTGVPVLFQTRDPLQVHVLEGASGPVAVVERFERTAGELRRLYPDIDLGEDDGDEDTTVEWTEYWDEECFCYWVGRKPVTKTWGKNKLDVVPHGYGCLPYSIGIARSTPRRETQKRLQPLLLGVENALRNYDVAFSILATAGKQSVVSSFGFFSDHPDKEVDLTPGAINRFAPDDKFEPIQRAPLPGDFFQLLNILQMQVQDGLFPAAMYGQMSAKMAGYAISMLMSSGRRPMLPIFKAMTDCYEGAFRNAVLICKNKVAPLIGSDQVPLAVMKNAEIGGVTRAVRQVKTLDVSKIDESFDCLVTMEDPMPQDDAQNLRMAIESTGGDNPLLSHITALEKFKLVSDPANEMERIAMERLWWQLMPAELKKLAVERGYAPKELPKEAQPQQPQGPQGQPQGGQQIPPELMQALMAQQQAAQQQPTGPGPVPQMVPPELQVGGQPTNAPQLNPIELQRMFGMPLNPELEQYAGTPPVLPAELGL